MNVRQVPEAALRNPDAVELARVWVAEEGLHCSFKIGMYHESTDVDERRDRRHIANALRDAYRLDPDKSIDLIRDAYIAELAAPTSDTRGGFVSDPH